MLKLKLKLDQFHMLRVSKGWTSATVAEQIDISRQAIYQIISGKTNASPKTAKAMCELLGVTVDQLFEMKEE